MDARQTGGPSFFPSAFEKLNGIYGAIAKELANQYAIAYVPAPAERNTFRRVAVLINEPGMRARTRSGYFAGG
ncbi:MAG: hypothetical protein AB7I50_22405 [Vicinamibacterales bacterium]